MVPSARPALAPTNFAAPERRTEPHAESMTAFPPPLTEAAQQPWWDQTLERSRVSVGTRILVCGASSPRHLAALRRTTGPQGLVFVVEPRLDAAEAAGRTGTETLHYRIEGDERFGVFDTLVVCALDAAPWPAAACAELACHNLRVGGRLLVDLPAEPTCAALAAAWREIGGDPRSFERLGTVPLPAWERTLEEFGLRGVEAAETTHLVPFESPDALAAAGAWLLGATTEQYEDLRLALVERLRTTGPVEVSWHRLRVAAMR